MSIRLYRIKSCPLVFNRSDPLRYIARIEDRARLDAFFSFVCKALLSLLRKILFQMFSLAIPNGEQTFLP
ncbi:hypothetical protein A7K93_01125 [Candidatus Methylacidiphilum fumarolicum]|nr:hypothetical protein A7K93_01125 [Candidatus Methylacidiphilum fumarolicum]